MTLPDPAVFTLCSCIDCARQLRASGMPPERPICRRCHFIRDLLSIAPEADHERLRRTLAPLPPDDPAAVTEPPEPEPVAELAEAVQLPLASPA